MPCGRSRGCGVLSMHMTHVLSRITLEIVSVNVDTATIKWIVTFRRVLP